MHLKVLLGGPALLLGGLYFTATTTFAKAEGIIWQMRAIGPVMLLLSPVLFWIAYSSLKDQPGGNDTGVEVE
jgi:hypothetical protein